MKLRTAKVEQRQASCDGKERFVSFSRAEKAAKKVAAHYETATRAYYCTSCHVFHVGSANAPGARRLDIDPRQPFLVFAVKAGRTERCIGRAPTPDGGKLAELLKQDGWTVTRVRRGRNL